MKFASMIGAVPTGPVIDMPGPLLPEMVLPKPAAPIRVPGPRSTRMPPRAVRPVGVGRVDADQVAAERGVHDLGAVVLDVDAPAAVAANEVARKHVARRAVVHRHAGAGVAQRRAVRNQADLVPERSGCNDGADEEVHPFAVARNTFCWMVLPAPRHCRPRVLPKPAVKDRFVPMKLFSITWPPCGCIARMPSPNRVMLKPRTAMFGALRLRPVQPVVVLGTAQFDDRHAVVPRL